MQKFIVTAKKAGHQTPDKTHGYQRSEHIFEKKNFALMAYVQIVHT